MTTLNDALWILILGTIFSVSVVLSSLLLIVYEVRTNAKRDLFYKKELEELIKDFRAINHIKK